MVKERGFGDVISLLTVLLLIIPVMPIYVSGEGEEGPDLSISSEDILFSPEHPYEKDYVTITIRVSNLGSPSVSDAILSVYDGDPDVGILIDEQMISVPEYDYTTTMVTWSTTGVSPGFHQITVCISGGEPADVNPVNNNATRELILAKTSDRIYTNATSTISEQLSLSGIIGIWGQARLFLINATVFVYQLYPYQYGIVVEDSGQLIVRNSVIWSNYPLNLIIRGTASCEIDYSSRIYARVRAYESSQLSVRNSHLFAGIDVSDINVTIESSTINITASFKNAGVEIKNSYFSLNDTFKMASATARIYDSEIHVLGEGGTDVYGMNISGSSNVSLYRCVVFKIMVIETSIVRIYRELTITAEDATGIPIPSATITIRNIFGLDKPQNGETDKKGNVSFTVLTDILQVGYPSIVGNYNVSGIKGSYRAYTIIDMPYYPNMTNETNHVVKKIIFEPMLELWVNRPGDREITKPTTIEGEKYVISGNLHVKSVLTIKDSKLFINQTKDFWANIIIYPGGKIYFKDGKGIESNKKLNIYIVGNGALSFEGTAISNIICNVIVGAEDESLNTGVLSLHNVIMHGSIMGTFRQVSITGNSYVEGILSYFSEKSLIYGTYVLPTQKRYVSSISGTSIEIIDCYIIMPKISLSADVNITIKDSIIKSEKSVMENFTINVSDICIVSQRLTVTGSDIEYSNSNIDVTSMIARSSTFSTTLEFKGFSTGDLTNVTTPDIIVKEDAQVRIYWFLNIYVKDRLEGLIDNAEVRVLNYSSGAPVQTKYTMNGFVSIPLKASEITKDGPNFVGNYKVEVRYKDLKSDKIPVEMSGNRILEVSLNYTPPIISMEIDKINISNTTNLTYNQTIYVTGKIFTIYKGGGKEPASGALIRIIVTGSGIIGGSLNWTGIADSWGAFNITIKAPPPSPQMYIVKLNASIGGLTYEEIIGNLYVPLPPPDSIKVEIKFPGRKKLEFLTNESIEVEGQILWVRGKEVADPVSNQTIYVKVGALISKETKTDEMGHYSVVLPALEYPGEYEVSVEVKNAKHPSYNISLSKTEIIRITIVKPKKVEVKAEGMNWLLIATGIIIAVGVVIALLFVYATRVSAAGLVECGECGALIPENSLICPKCKTEFEIEIVKCSECEAWIPGASTSCPKCGAVFKVVK